MEDPELAAIRAARIQQLKQQGGSSSPSAGRPAPSGEGEDGAQRAAEEEMRRNLLATVLDSSARERCTSWGFSWILLHSCFLVVPPAVSRISLVSPERSRQIESILLRMAQTGQLKSKVTEDQLIGLLEQVCAGSLDYGADYLAYLFCLGGRGKRGTEEEYDRGMLQVFMIDPQLDRADCCPSSFNVDQSSMMMTTSTYNLSSLPEHLG
jgi:programmed cell death protein 5